MYAPEAIIRLERVTRYFGPLRALHDVSLAVQAGEKIVVVGPAGSGKSTLLRTINGLEEIDGGRIVVDGCEVSDRQNDLNKIRMGVGMVSGRFRLFSHHRVLDNLTLAPVKLRGIPKAEAEQEGLMLLAKVGVLEKAHYHPTQLTEGEQRLVLIARALTMHPKIMLLDEPTLGLDGEMRREVLEVMVNLARDGMTMVVVSLEQEFAREAADRVVVMERGEILEVGHPAGILARPGRPHTQRFLAKIS